MALELPRPHAGPRSGDLRQKIIPWLAAAANALHVLSTAARRRVVPFVVGAARGSWPTLRMAGRATAATTGWWTDVIARAVRAAAAAVVAAVVAVERRLVPGLQHLGRGADRAVGWLVDRLATASLRTGHAAVTVAVPAAWRWARPRADATARLAGTGALLATRRTGRAVGAGWLRLRPRLPRLALRGGTLVGFAVAVVALASLLSGPALKLAATAVSPEITSPETGGMPPLEERSVVYAADGSTLAILHQEVDRRVVPLDRIPEHVRQAVIAAEDRRFYEHEGYDLEAIGRASLANVRAGGVSQGGSTITQQLAKQNFVGADRTMARKANELLHAVALEGEFSKDELLERYLNQVYFGSGAYGIAAASEEFFGIPPEELTVDQAALLAGLIRSPGSLDPRAEPERATARRDVVLRVMADEGYLSPGQAADLATVPLELGERRRRESTEPGIVEAVKREFIADEAFGASREERVERLFTGGLRIHTTVDPRLQDLASAAVAAHVSGGEGPTGALAAVEPGTGRIRALHSGVDFSEEQFDLAAQGRRQPGSAFKPFVAAAALEAGMSPWQPLLGDGPATFDVPGSSEPWRVANHLGRDHGPVPLGDAMRSSVNTAFAQLILGVGVDEVADVAARSGIDVERALGPPDTRGPSIALGGLTRGVSPLELAAAYGMFANEGDYAEPHLIAEVTDASGEVLMERAISTEPALEPAVAGTLVDILEQAVQEGTGTAARIPGWPVAGKTGTTQDSADAWFVGTVPVLSTAVWVGHPEAQRPIPGLTGGSAPARIWQQFMSEALDGTEPTSFPDAGGPPGSTWIDLPGPRSLD
jgi:membrane peptidoglycan carboxypeptidase